MEYFILVIIILVAVYFIHDYILIKKRERFIAEYRFPKTIGEKIKSTYPHLDKSDIAEVIDTLATYFSICNDAKLKIISMPSQVVDLAWHEFILFTRRLSENGEK